MVTLDPPELVEAMEMFLKEQANIAPVKKEIEYRLYYDPSTGKPLFMSPNDEPGSYVVITKEQYDKPQFASMRVVDNKLVYINREKHTMPLVKGAPGYQSVKGHAGILVDNQTTVETQTYGFKTN